MSVLPTRGSLPIPTHPPLTPCMYGLRWVFSSAHTDEEHTGMTAEETLTCFPLDSC